jgi:signal transduction histidine kinase
VAGFRTRLVVAMMLLVSVVATAGLLFAQHNVAATVKQDFEREFQAEVAALDAGREVRHALLAERCRALARRPRIHAALEDDALDLLYPSARDELLDVMAPAAAPAGSGGRDVGGPGLRAAFYRFLDGQGRVLAPPDGKVVGELDPRTEAALSLPRLPEHPQTGYIARATDEAGDEVDEVIAMPIISSEHGETISAIVLGFKTVDLTDTHGTSGIRRGVWLDGRLHLPALTAAAQAALASRLAGVIAGAGSAGGSREVRVLGVPYLLFYKQLNPDSLFPAAFGLSLYPLADSLARQRQLLWEFAGAGLVLWLVALGTSQVISLRLAQPVERLALDSAANRSERERAEAALATTHQELRRSARFSADASHQLKTPVTVMRAGLENLLAEPTLGAATREELSGLVHQTFRLTTVIDELLLLSRLDAGRMQLELKPLDLVPLIEAGLDDLGALPDAAAPSVSAELPATLPIAGDRTYTALILQNLLENARKYNRPGGRIQVTARVEDGWAVLTVGNTGRPIAPEAQGAIFERFHRGSAGEDVPGHGLGLNLARELARLHGGDLVLLRSAEDWTEFAARFRAVDPAADAAVARE